MAIRRYKFAFALLVASSASAPAAWAQEGVRADRIISAGALEQECAANDSTETGRLGLAHCLGAITGIADAAMTLIAVYSGQQSICLETDDNAESMRLAFLSHLQRNPRDRELPAATVVIAVLAKNYPCKG